MAYKKVFIVEDDPSDIDLIIAAFRKIKLRQDLMFIARDGEEALECLFGQGKACVRSLSFVMLDLKLPKVDGFEVLREIRRNRETELLPVVVFSSSNDSRDIEESYRLGANSYICKPMEFERFIDVVAYVGNYWLIYNEVSAGLIW